MTRRCFVISPIAAHNSEIREHADDVFDFIIKPSMDELGIEVYRSDHSQEIGRITEQMFNSILNDDLCLAVLTYFNPNVFYELAIAQSAARPVIILIEKGQTIPFDVRDLRADEYDLRPRPLRDKVYVQQIINLAKGLEKSDWIIPVPFGNNLTPLGFKGSELKLHDKLENFGPSDRWMQLLRDARSQIDLTGLSLRWWRKLLGFGPLLREKGRIPFEQVRCYEPFQGASQTARTHRAGYWKKQLEPGRLQSTNRTVRGRISFADRTEVCTIEGQLLTLNGRKEQSPWPQS
jgi:hypothetical protein